MSAFRRCVTRRSALLSAASIAALVAAGCSPAESEAPLELASATELTKGLTPAADDPDRPAPVEVLIDEGARLAACDFAMGLFRHAYDAREAGNILVSPLSVERCLAMVQNGAAGETLAQMESALGFSRDDLNAYLHAYQRRVDGDLYGLAGTDGFEPTPLPLSLAESVWVRDDPSPGVRDDFLQANVDAFDASVFTAPFDEGTVSDINGWVSAATDGMIDGIVEEIPAGALLYLVSALAFDARWESPYEDADVRSATFTSEDGAVGEVSLMDSREEAYLEGERCVGFMRPYESNDFAFVGLLPKEGVTVADLVASLDGAALLELLAPVGNCVVDASLPKFELEYDASLVDCLRALGMTDAFGDAADFSLMADVPLQVSEVRHRTYISVSETGTQAAAATSAGMAGASAPSDEEPEVMTVVLDRPFVYLLIDYQTLTPLFTGAVESL